MPRVSRVGDGHTSPSFPAHYATLALWWASESATNYGSQIEAHCLGDIGVSTTLSGDAPHGALIYTSGVTYDGSNQSSLAMLSGSLTINGADITIQDLMVDGLVGVLGTNATLNRARVLGGINYNSVGTIGKSLNNCVINRASSFVITYGSGDQGDVNNCLIFGTTGTGVITGGGGDQNLRRNFSFNNGGNDYQGTTASFVTNASEDLTGSSGWTGYTSAELVDFIGDDFRTKSTSDLADDGAGGFIGAFLEASGTPELNIVGSTPSYSFTVPDADVTLTGELNIVGSTPSYNYTVPTAIVDLTGELNIVGSTPSYSYTVPTAPVDLTGELNIVGSTPSYSYTVPTATVDLTGELNIVGSTPSYSYTVPTASVYLTGDLVIVATTPTYSYNAVNAVVAFSGTITFSGDVILNSLQFSGHDVKAPVATFASISGDITFNKY